MISDRKDFLERLLEQLQELFKAIVGMGSSVNPKMVFEKIEGESPSLFGVPYRILLQFDAPTLFRLLGHPAKVMGLAKIIMAEAAVLRAAGNEPSALGRFRHASSLADQAAKEGTPADDELVKLLQNFAAQQKGQSR